MDKERPKRVLATLGTPADDLDFLRNLIAKKKKKEGGIVDDDEPEALGEDDEDDKPEEEVDDILDKESPTKRKTRIIKRRTRFMPKRGNAAKDNENREQFSELALALKSYTLNRVVDLEDEVKHFKEKRYEIGDVVSILDEEDNKYFAQIIGFHRDEELDLFVSIRWLIPKSIYFGILTASDFENFDPLFFEPGPIHESMITIKAIKFVRNEPLPYI